MAFLVRCPCCKRPKRVGEQEIRHGEGDPEAWCISCGIYFVAWVDQRYGVSMAVELPPFGAVSMSCAA